MAPAPVPPRPHPSRARTRTLWPLVLLILARLAVGLLYSVVVPSWEAYDEDGHFAYARYLALYHHLLQPGDPEAEKVWENFQPPLYYLLVAPSIATFDLGLTGTLPPKNPYFAQGDAGYNYALHPPALTGVPQQLDQAVHAARLVSILISLVGVLFVFLAARRLWPGAPGKVWAATCLYAFWPQFLFNGSMVTNDTLVSMLAAATLYLGLRLADCGFTLRDGLLLGGVLIAALFTKLNALAFLPAILLALGLSLHVPGRSRLASGLALGVLGGLVVAALAAIRSFQFIAQQVFRAETVLAFFQHVASRNNLAELWGALHYSFQTFAGSFGWGNLQTRGWFYQLWAAAALLGVAGLLLGLWQRRLPLKLSRLALMGLQALSSYGLSLALAIASQNFFLTHGRYLLPALPAVCLGLISGWQMLVPRRWQPRLWKTVGVGIVVLGWSISFTTLLPAYARPQPATAAQLQTLQPVDANWGGKIKLLGYLPLGAGTAGQTLPVTLCWEAMAPIDTDYSVILNVAGPDGQGYGELQTYPGRGNYATSFWAVHTPFCDRYAVPLGQGLPAPAIAQLYLGLLDHQTYQWLPVTDLAGKAPEVKLPAPAVIAPELSQRFYLPAIMSNFGIKPPNLTPIIVPFKVVPAPGAAPAPMHTVEYHFGSALLLRGYDIRPLGAGQRGVKVVLHWEAQAKIAENLVVFVHLRDTPAHAYAQNDAEPRQGWYPTPWWAPGETVLDEHPLPFPDGAAPPLALYVGVYTPATSARLPVTDAQGQPVLNNEVILAQGLTLP